MNIVDIDVLLALKEATERTGKTYALKLAVRRLNELSKLTPAEFESLIAPLHQNMWKVRKDKGNGRFSQAGYMGKSNTWSR